MLKLCRKYNAICYLNIMLHIKIGKEMIHPGNADNYDRSYIAGADGSRT
jgi:hypothetical protein